MSLPEVKKTVIEFGDLIGIGVGAILGYTGGIIGAVAGAAGGYFVAKQLTGKKTFGHSPPAKYQMLSETESSHPRRFGQPLTEEERRQRHYALYGTTELPPRGTGLTKAKYEKL
jgi:uncharacterized protein YneF (UPF0154 family)